MHGGRDAGLVVGNFRRPNQSGKTTNRGGAVLGNKNQNGNAGGANQQKGGIGGILDAIGGKQSSSNKTSSNLQARP